ncbi:BTB/POZ domain-containing protein kctd6 [Borealophlyctis nickersoniae]|nr:BTB/POZ domain-containing protein kctd6 [Borealophlyctis nickersoniae]
MLALPETTMQDLSTQADNLANTVAQSNAVETEALTTLQNTIDDLKKTAAQIECLLGMTTKALAACVARVDAAKGGTETYMKSITTAAQTIADTASRERKRIESIKAEMDDERKTMALDHQQAMNAFMAGKRVSEAVAGDQKKKVKLDIGGQIFSISLSTLLSAKEGFFNSLFREEWNVQPGEDGTIFIDRDPTVYRYIFNYLREGSAFLVPDDTFTLNCVKHEAAFLGLDGLEKVVDGKLATLAANLAAKAAEEDRKRFGFAGPGKFDLSVYITTGC